MSPKFPEFREHEWIKNKKGQIDDFAYDEDGPEPGIGHSGPKCSVCGFFFCDSFEGAEQCLDPSKYPCPGPPPLGKTWLWWGGEPPKKEPDGFEEDMPRLR